MPKITVIVPVYKVEPYIHRCVDSILAQIFADFELILVDDGSPDNCGTICDEFASEDARIHVIHQKNAGLSAARNAGIDWAFANSDSEWLAFIDSDDWVHPQYLELLYQAAQAGHTKISVCEYIETEQLGPVDETAPGTRLMNWDELFLEKNLIAILAWNKLYAKELFEGLRYPVGKIHEDEFLTYKLLIRAGKCAYLSAALYYYFINPHGITKSRFSLNRLDVVDALEERIAYVKPMHNRKVMEYCVRSFLSCSQDRVFQLRTAEHIPSELRAQKEREIKLRCRIILARYGLQYAPPKKCKTMYQFAFPGLYRIGKAIKTAFRKKNKN